MNYTISEICVGCGVCYHECPNHAVIRIEKNHYEIGENCRSCGVCFNACPMNAIICIKNLLSKKTSKTPALA